MTRIAIKKKKEKGKRKPIVKIIIGKMESSKLLGIHASCKFSSYSMIDSVYESIKEKKTLQPSCIIILC